MIKKAIIIFILVVSTQVWSQINFEKGYYINKYNKKIEGLIKNKGWLDNPKEIYFKKDSISEPLEIKIVDLLEFQIDKSSKYKMVNVKMDMSSHNINDLSATREPVWENQTILLKCIVESQFNLYEYKDGQFIRYFCSKDNSVIEQLVYKRYNVNAEYYINSYFLQQLFQGYRCNTTTEERVKNVTYKLGSLRNYFLEINRCSGNIVNEKAYKSDVNRFNIKIKSGLNNNSLFIDFSERDSDISFDNKTTARFGAELEYILPFNKNKWSLFLESSYLTSYAAETELIDEYNGSFFRTSSKYAVKYNALDLSLGGRYYMFLNNSSKMFVNVATNYSFDINKDLSQNSNSEYLDVDTEISFSYGLGFAYKNFSLEYRYNKRDIMKNSLFLQGNYTSSSLILGYSIFSNINKNPNQK